MSHPWNPRDSSPIGTFRRPGARLRRVIASGCAHTPRARLAITRILPPASVTAAADALIGMRAARRALRPGTPASGHLARTPTRRRAPARSRRGCAG